MTQVLAPFASPMLRAARAIKERDGGRPRVDLTSEQKKVARHMAHDGATVFEIAAVLNLPCTVETLQGKLRRLNIHPRLLTNRAKRGDITSLPKGSEYGALWKPYRPKGRLP